VRAPRVVAGQLGTAPLPHLLPIALRETDHHVDERFDGLLGIMEPESANLREQGCTRVEDLSGECQPHQVVDAPVIIGQPVDMRGKLADSLRCLAASGGRLRAQPEHVLELAFFPPCRDRLDPLNDRFLRPVRHCLPFPCDLSRIDTAYAIMTPLSVGRRISQGMNDRITAGERFPAFLALASSMGIVGASMTANKFIVGNIPIMLASGIRCALATLVMLVLVRLVDTRLPHIPRNLHITLALQAFTGIFAFNVLALLGVGMTTATISGIITAMTPAVIAIISFALG